MCERCRELEQQVEAQRQIIALLRWERRRREEASLRNSMAVLATRLKRSEAAR